MVLSGRKVRFGNIYLKQYISLYSLGRFFIEGLRTDSLYFMNIRVAQLVSLLGIIIGIVAIIIIVSRGKKKRKGIFIN